MSDSPLETSLLVDLDRRQNEVLAQLDELNEKVEQLLSDCLTMRSADYQSAGM